MTTYQRTADGGQVYIRDIARDALGITDADLQRRIDQIQRDRIDAWLDIACERTGVHKATLITALSMRADAATRDVDREMINETAAQLARPGSPVVPAVYHNGRRDARRAAASSDEAFRASLAAKLDGARADHADGASDDADDAPAPGNVPTVKSLTEQSALESAEFSAHLARLARKAGEAQS